MDGRDSRLKGNFRLVFTLIIQKSTPGWRQNNKENYLPVLGMHQEVAGSRMNSFPFRVLDNPLHVQIGIYIITWFSTQMVMHHTKVTMNKRTSEFQCKPSGLMLSECFDILSGWVHWSSLPQRDTSVQQGHLNLSACIEFLFFKESSLKPNFIEIYENEFLYCFNRTREITMDLPYFVQICKSILDYFSNIINVVIQIIPNTPIWFLKHLTQ